MELLFGPRTARLGCRRSQLESRSATFSATPPAPVAASVRRPINAAFAIQDQASVGIGSIGATGEAVQYLLCPFAAFGLRRTQLEQRPAILVEGITRRAFAATKVGCAIQVACAVEYQIADGEIPILAAFEAVQYGFGPCAILAAPVATARRPCRSPTSIPAECSPRCRRNRWFRIYCLSCRLPGR